MPLVGIIGGGIIPFTTAAAASPVLTNLVAWYKFDDGSGQVLTDYSGNGNHGQLGSTAGADTNDPAWVADGLSFDGVDNEVLLPLAAADDWTIMIVTAKTLTTLGYFLGRQDSTLDRYGFSSATNLRGIGINNSGIVNLGVTDEASANYHCYTLRVDRATIVRSVRDHFDLSGQDVVVEDVSSRFNKFGRLITTSPFTGVIAYALFYNSYLSDAEILQNYAFLADDLAARGIVLYMGPRLSAMGTTFTSASMAGTVDVNVPAHTAGDLLILAVLMRNDQQDGTLSAINTAGWTLVGGSYGGALNVRAGVGWKIGNGSETIVNITTTGGATTDRIIARVIQVGSSYGFDAVPLQNVGTVQTGTGTTITMATVAPSGPNQLAVAVQMTDLNISTEMISATGESGGDWTEAYAQDAQTNGVMQIQTSDQSGGGTISGGTITITSCSWLSLGFTIVPATI